MRFVVSFCLTLGEREMKYIELYRFAIVLLALFMTACHGGGDGGGDEPSRVTTTTVGNATVTKEFKPNVVIFSDAASISEVTPGTFKISGPPQGFGVNSVFTWKDRPYVVKSVVAVTGDTMTVSTRDAEISEVLSRLTVSGDLTLDDADLARLAIVDESSTDIVPQVSGRETVPVARKTVKVGPCTGTTNDSSQNGSTTIVCTLLNRTVQSGLFVINGSVGIKDIRFSGISLSLSGVETVSNVQATPYVELSGQVTTSNARPGEVKGNLEVARMRVPIEATLGFVSIGVPVFLSYGVPLYNLGIRVTGAFPYVNGAFSFVGTLQTPTASVSTTGAVTSQINDAFLGIKSGVELSLTRYPTPVMSLLSGAVGWPLTDDRILSTGIYGTLGTYGSLSFQLTPPSTTACFKWKLGPRVDALVETSLLGDPISALSTTPLTLYPNSGISGETGCGPSIAITKASCSFYAQGMGTRYYIFRMTGTAQGPVGAVVQGISNPSSGIDPNHPLGTSCSAWSPYFLVGFGYSVCKRETEQQPETTEWSSYNVISSATSAYGFALLAGNGQEYARASTSEPIPCTN